MDWIAVHQFLLAGLAFMIVIGPAVGNYACSVVYRLPRGQTPFERHPFCGHCNADLKPIDLAPIISWFLTRGKCRYCGGAIPSIYTIIEITCGLVFIAYFLQFGISEPFIIYTAYATFVVIAAAIQWQQGWLSCSIYGYAITCAVLARVLAEHTIYGSVKSIVMMMTLMLCVMRLGGKPVNPLSKPWLWWFVLLGVVVPVDHWSIVAGIYAVKLCIPKQWRVVVYAASALVLPLILPLLT